MSTSGLMGAEWNNFLHAKLVVDFVINDINNSM